MGYSRTSQMTLPCFLAGFSVCRGLDALSFDEDIMINI